MCDSYTDTDYKTIVSMFLSAISLEILLPAALCLHTLLLCLLLRNKTIRACMLRMTGVKDEAWLKSQERGSADQEATVSPSPRPPRQRSISRVFCGCAWIW